MMRAISVVALIGLAGCAATGPDGGFAEIDEAVKARTGVQTRWVRSDDEARVVREQVTALLGKPLSADDAVRIALINNPGLQASYAELGIARGDLISAGVLPNPHFGYGRAQRGDTTTVETVISFNILSLITVPLRMRAQAERFEQVKQATAAEAVRVGAEARKAYFRALGAAQLAAYMEDVKTTAEASAELARRMAGVGNFPKLDYMREQAFYSEATVQLGRARQLAVAERERLVRVLGLWGDQVRLQLPERMPDLPTAPRELQDAEQTAMEQRLDLRAARRDAEAFAKSLGYAQVTRFFDEIEVGVTRERETGEPVKKGWEISVPIPLFDWGGGRVTRADAMLMQAASRLAEAAVNARSEVREQYQRYRAAYDTARHYRDEVVPLRKRISEEVLLRYNGMLASTFELLADSREQVTAVAAAIDQQREFWIAEADLNTALTGRSPGSGEAATATSTPRAAGAAGGH
jgi:outer membrane protein TolC